MTSDAGRLSDVVEQLLASGAEDEHTVTVMFGDAVEIVEGADELKAEPGTIFLLPCKLRRVGEWRWFLIPCGERAGLMALEVKLVKRER